MRRDNKILLLRRYQTGYEDGNYSVVAGHLDGGEQVIEAAIREAREEAGIALKPEQVTITGIMHRLSDDERIDFFVTATEWSGEIYNAEPHKCDELAWFSIHDLPQNTISYIKKRLSYRSVDLKFGLIVTDLKIRRYSVQTALVLGELVFLEKGWFRSFWIRE
ncbi:NUDIX hydrolase [Brevibacillus laterosporus]